MRNARLDGNNNFLRQQGQAAQADSPESIRVLVVEDESDTALMLKMLLERRFSATVEIAEDCASAREKFKSQTFDIITLDYQLPDGDGLELLEQIKAMEDPSPVIMVTGHGDEQTAVRSFKLGSNGYVVKGKRLSVLLADAVEHALSDVRLRRAEEALSLEQQQLLSIFESIAEVIYVVDPASHEILYANKFLKDAFGKDLVGGICHRELQELDEPCDFCTNEIILKDKGNPYTWEYHNPVLDRDYLVTDRIIKWPDDRDVRFELAIDITEHKEAEERVQSLSSVVEQSSEGMAVSDLDGYLLFVNPAWARMHGYESAEELTGLHLNVFHNQEQVDGEVVPFNKAVVENGFCMGEVGHIRKDCTPFPTLMTSTLIKDKDGNPVAMSGICKDITERKRAEESLRKSEATYRAIFNAANDAMFIHDTHTGEILDVNRKMCELYDYTREEARELNVEDMSSGEPPYTQEDALRWIRKAVEGDPQLFEWRARDKAGRLFWVEVNLKQATIAGEDRLLAVVRDITERKAAQALRESEERYRTLFECSRDALMTLSPPSWRFTSCNPKALEMFRARDEKEFTSVSPWGLSPDLQPDGRASADKAREMIDTALRDGSFLFEWKHKRFDGEDFPATVMLTRMEISGQTVVQATVRDITELERQEALQRANVELEGYAHTVSHDLKGPITGIMLAVDMLADSLDGIDTKGVQETSEIIATVTRNARNAQRRVEYLLALAESGQEPRETSPVDVGEVVQGVLEERSHEVKEKGLEVNTSSDMGTIIGDPVQIQQVFSNLICNAITHNDSENPVIEITYLGDGKDGSHRYLVRDNGPGIPDDVIEDVFLPFTRGKGGDTGIGLSIVKKLVKVYGGEIRAYNDNGACLEFTLRDFQK